MFQKISCIHLLVKSGSKHKIGSEDNNVDDTEDDGNDNNYNGSTDDKFQFAEKKKSMSIPAIRVILLQKFLK